MKIYGDLRSGNCLKIKYVCDYLNIPYEWIAVDIMKGETKTESFLQLNPAGQVPVVVFPEGKALAQSNAIIKHLARGSILVPQDIFAEAKMDEWLFWEQYSHETAIAVLRYKKLYLKLPAEKIEPDLITKSHATLQIMEKHLGTHNFFVEKKLSLADIALLAYTRLAHEADLDLDKYPSVKRWVELCENELKIR